MQRPIDGLYHNKSITGVPVVLTAIDSAGAVTEIGSTTTNGYYGTFGVEWTPPNEGMYSIVASFAGDESYGSSSAASSLTVGPAPTPITIPEQTTPPDYTMTIIASAVAVIIAVVLATLLILRKK